MPAAPINSIGVTLAAWFARWTSVQTYGLSASSAARALHFLTYGVRDMPCRFLPKFEWESLRAQSRDTDIAAVMSWSLYHPLRRGRPVAQGRPHPGPAFDTTKCPIQFALVC